MSIMDNEGHDPQGFGNTPPRDISKAVRSTLQKTGEQFRDMALDRCAEICDDLHMRGLDASACAFAIRKLKEVLHAVNGEEPEPKEPT